MESFWSSLWLTVLNHSDDSYLLPSSELPFFLFTFTITFIFLYFRFSLTSHQAFSFTKGVHFFTPQSLCKTAMDHNGYYLYIFSLCSPSHSTGSRIVFSEEQT